MKKLIIWLALLLPFIANAQVNGTIQKTSSSGTIRGSFGSLGIDTIPRVTGVFVNGYILKYHAATNKWYASPDGYIAGLQDSLTKKANRTFDNVASGAIPQAKVNGLVSDLALKAPIASPTFTGTPLAPTATAGTNTTQIATTAFVTNGIATSGADYVNLTGTQTISGSKTFSAVNTVFSGITAITGIFGGNVLPNATDTYNLGLPSFRWNNIYVNSMTGVAAAFSSSLSASSLSITGAGIFGGNVIPNATNTYDLGISSFRWNTINGSNLDLTGTSTVSGAGSYGGLLTVPSVKITTGANTGYVLTSDADGDASWQSPSSGLVYKGAWNASTNSPTLADGTGTNGDMYAVSTGGTQFGRTFVAGGFAIYNGSIWQPVGTSSAVTSVNTYTGSVTLAKSDIGLGNVDNTSDVNKPISTATQTALDLKAPLASPTFTGTLTSGGAGIFAGNVIPSANNAHSLGLTSFRWSTVYGVNGDFSGALSASNLSGTNTGDNATNTTSNTYADAKVQNSLTASTTIAPSATAVNTALALKADIASPALTGNPTAPTQTQGDNSTKIATTAYVDGSLTSKTNRILKDWYTDANNVTTAETDLYDYTVPSNTLINNGDKLYFEIGGSYSGTANTKEIKLTFGSTGFIFGSTTSAGGNWTVKGFLVKTGATSYRIVASNTDDAPDKISTYSNTGSVTNYTGTNIFKISATGGASADITAKAGYLEFKPAAP